MLRAAAKLPKGPVLSNVHAAPAVDVGSTALPSPAPNTDGFRGGSYEYEYMERTWGNLSGTRDHSEALEAARGHLGSLVALKQLLGARGGERWLGWSCWPHAAQQGH
jgi:hypothetical protein